MKEINLSSLHFTLDIVIQFRHFIVIQLLIAIFGAVNISLRPYIIKVMLNNIALVPSSQALHSLGPPIIAYILIYIIMILAFRFYDWIIFCFHPLLKKHISTTLIGHMLEQSPAFYHNHLAGSVLNKINDITNAVPNIINIIIDKLFSITLSLIVAVYTIWTVDIKFAIGLIVWIIIFVTLSIKMSARIRILSDQAAEARSTIAGHIIDIFANIVNVCFFARKAFEGQYLNKLYQENIKVEQLRGWFLIKVHTLQQASFIIFQLICFYWLILGIESQTTTAGDFALILILNISIVNYLQNISRDLEEFSTSLGNLTQGLRLIATPLYIKDTGSTDIKIIKGEIIFEHVKFGYAGNSLFENLCVKILPGQKVGLVGYSGAGKSTFVNLILRLFDTQEGRIMIDNQDIKDISLESLRKAIGIIPQEPLLFYRTVLDNIRYAKENTSEAEIIEATKKAYAHDFICNLTNSYNTLLGEKGAKLSGGELQRVAIARIILKNPSILILDEATSHLDPVTELMIQESLISLMEHKTSIVIAHRLSTLLNMDRILVFDKGKIVQDGSHKDLIAVRGMYKTLWDTQHDGFLPLRKNNLS